jgi:dynein heavy chain
MDNGCLSEAANMELTCEMPIMLFRPVSFEAVKGRRKGMHLTPLYMYPVRTGPDTRPSYMMDVDLKTGAKDSTFWTRRGTALLLSLDK